MTKQNHNWPRFWVPLGTHGSGFLDGNGFVHYTPDANYFGAAQLEYNLQAATGRAANDEMYRRAA